MINSIPFISIILIGISFVIPNTFNPWTTLWPESFSLIGMILITAHYLLKKEKIKSNKNSLALLFLFAIAIIFDYLTKNTTLNGDYYLSIIYISIFFFATLIGQNLEEHDFFFAIIIFSATLSAIICIAQWSIPELKNLYIREVPPAGRPFANLGQPNHLATFLSLGLVSLFAIGDYFSKSLRILISFILCFGIALSQSRTGIVQVFAISIFSSLILDKEPKQRIYYLYLIPLLIICIVLIKNLSAILVIENSRDLVKEGVQSLRFQHWISLIEPIKNNFWSGYGWLGTANAHLNDATNTAQEGVLGYAHNLFIDLVVWFGFIPGLIISIAIVHITFSFFQTKSNNKQKFSWIGFFIFLVHCLLEYPFAYIHFLVVAGLFLGISLKESKNNFLIKKNQLFILLASVTFISANILIEIIKITPAIERLRYANAGIITKSESTRQKYHFINQLEIYIHSYNRLPDKSIDEESLNSYNIATNRFAIAPITFKAAAANYYKGNFYKADDLMDKLCKINSNEICKHYKTQYEQLKTENINYN